MHSEMNNIGAFLVGKHGTDIAEITAGTTYDNAPYTTEEIDRDGYDSCQVQLSYSAALTSAKSLLMGLGIQDCATSGGTYSAVTSVLTAGTTISTASGGATTPKGVYNVNVNLAAYNRYIKFVLTPNLDATGTDTVKPTVVAVLGGKYTP